MSNERLRVLIVDDEASFRQPLKMFLESDYGYVVQAVSSGHEALEAISAGCKFDVAVIDQSLVDGPTGIEIALQLKADCQDIEIIILTGWGLETAKQAQQAGVFRFVEKGFTSPDAIALLIRSAAQQLRLRIIGRDILRKRDLEQILQVIIDAARSLTTADEVAIALPSRTGKGVQIYPPLTPIQSQWQHHFRGKNLTQEIILTGRPIQVLNTKGDERVSSELIDSDIKAFIGVPIPGHGTNIGVLYAYSRSDGGFDRWGTQTILQTLSSQVGLAIANVQAYEEEQLRAKEFQQLYAFSADLAQSLNLEDVLEHLAKAARQQIRSERATALVRLNDKEPFTYLLRGDSEDPVRLPPIVVQPRPGGFTETHIFEKCEPFLVDDLRKHPRRSRKILRQGICSAIGVPIQFQGNAIGALYAHSRQTAAFSVEHLTRLQYLTNQAGIALHNAMQFQEAKLRGDLLEAMAQQLRHIQGEKQPEKLQQDIVRLAVELLHCDFGGLFRNRTSTEDLELLAAWEFSPETEPFLIPHSTDIIGSTALSAEGQLKNNVTAGSELSTREHVTALMAVPFLHLAQVEAVLFVGSRDPQRAFVQRDLDVLGKFADQAAVAWRTSKLLGMEQRRFLQLEILHQIGDYVQANADLYRIYHVALTGITAGYGLGYNRAALLLLDDTGQFLMGRMGIGEIMLAEARYGWQTNRESNLDEFRKYIEALEMGQLAPTAIERSISRLALPYKQNPNSRFCQVMETGKWTIINDRVDLEQLPKEFCNAFAPELPLAVVAVRARNQTIGLLVVDNKFTKTPITRDDIDALKTFVNTVAIAVDNTLLLQKTQDAERELRSLYAASNTVLSDLDPEKILSNVVEQAREATNAASVSAVLIDTHAGVRELATCGDLEGQRIDQVIRANGLSMQVMDTGEPRYFSDAALDMASVNSSVRALGIVAGLCVPLGIEGKRIGVMWYHYRQSRRFSHQQVETFQLYANQAVLAWDLARRMRHLQGLRTAYDILADVQGARDIMSRIAEQAQQALSATWTVLWPYDEGRSQYFRELAVACGVESSIWDELRQKPQLVESIDKEAIASDQVQALSLEEPESSKLLADQTRELLMKAGVRCLQVVSLAVGHRIVGVLYAFYRQPHIFDTADVAQTRMFARHAALVLQRSKLLEHIDRTHKGALAAARIVVLEKDVQATLQTIVNETNDALGADDVILCAYNHERMELSLPPAAAGSHDLAVILRNGSVLEGSIEHRILERDNLYWTENAVQDEIFQRSDFVRCGVISIVAAPILAGGRKLGIMFVTYHQPHQFDDSELDDVRFFANIAAVAIHNAQMYDALKQVKGFVGSVNAFHWMDMVSKGWGHAIRREVSTAMGRLELLRRQLHKSSTNPALSAHLDALAETLAGISDIPIVAPLSSDDAVESVRVNELINTYLKRKREHPRYRSLELVADLEPELDEEATLRASRLWLRQLLDIFLDNAEYAMRSANNRRKCVRIKTRLVDQHIHVHIVDNGPGIPPQLLDKLYEEPVSKAVGSRGAGLGLMHAKAIVSAYNGVLPLPVTSSAGTEFAVIFPIEATTTR